MNLNESQILFIRSILQNIVESNTAPFSITVEAPGEKSLLTVQREDPDSSLLFTGATESNVRHVSPADAIDSLLAGLQESQRTIRIEQEGTVQRLGLRGNSIFRETVDQRPDPLKNPLWAVGKTTHLDPNQAAPLLQAIGLMTPEGEIKAPLRKKFKQVNHFLELLQPFLTAESPRSSFTLMDCGCGKSYLSFVLFWYIRRVMEISAQFVGIDISQERIDHCQKLARELSLPEMVFQCAPIRSAKIPPRIDLLISLHACDTATDEALALAVASKAARIAVAPCCQHELAHQLQSIPYYPLAKHGLFKQRFADLLTDMLRCLFLETHGYSVTVGEFVSVEETPKNLLIRAQKGKSSSPHRQAEYETFKHEYHLSPSIDQFLLELESRF